jgi:hypothetical protein
VNAPAADEIEVSVFSRSGGEAIAIHVGASRWLLIDSLNSEHGRPITLEYLEQIGVDPACVEGILLTHWHDDHIEGAAKLVRSCLNAKVAIPATLKRDEFAGFMDVIEPSGATSFGSGVAELIDVLKVVLDERGDHPRWGIAQRTLFSGNLPSYALEALSPSDADMTNFVASLKGWVEAVVPGGRIPAPPRNDASVAAVVSVLDERLLFGADLEVSKPDSGWHAVQTYSWNGRPKASFLKVPHHGSKNADFPAMWADMVVPNVYAALTPWNKNKKLPQDTDVNRIVARTNNAFSASKAVQRKAMRRMSTVDGMLRDAGIVLTRAPTDVGFVRFRKQLLSIEDWAVECLGVGSYKLEKIAA